jgi:hypothetical protein
MQHQSFLLVLYKLIFIMRMKTEKTLLTLLIFLFVTVDLCAQWGEEEQLLFVIKRSRDVDEIHYTVRLDSSGKPHQQNPIRAYWVKHTAGGKQAPLTWIQKKYAYGIHLSKTDADEISFHFVSKTDQQFKLRKDNTGRYHAFTKFGDTTLRADSLHIHFDGGSFMQPGIAAIHIFGQDIESGIIQKMNLMENSSAYERKNF